MDDDVVFGLDVAYFDAPALGRGRFKHHARRRSALAHRTQEVARAARPVSVLITISQLITRSLRDLDARPVGIELIGHNHRVASPHALAHFGAMAEDRYRAVLRARNETVGGV